jgi:hypothetical protein
MVMRGVTLAGMAVVAEGVGGEVGVEAAQLVSISETTRKTSLRVFIRHLPAVDG